MIFYIALDENGHRKLCKTQAEARAINKDFEQIDIPVDKPGLHQFVQNLFTQIDTEEAAPAPAPVSYTDQLLHFEDEWDNFPLARKLHFASLAMEDARTAIK